MSQQCKTAVPLLGTLGYMLCDETLIVFSTEKQCASEVLNLSRRDGQGSSKAIHMQREKTLASGCAHSPLLAQDCSEVAKRPGKGSCLALEGSSWLQGERHFTSLFSYWSGYAWDEWQGTVFLPHRGGAQRMVDGAFLPTRSVGEKLRCQYRCFMPFFPTRANKLVTELLGERRCFFPFCPSTGKELEGPVLQDRWTTSCCCCNDTQLSHKFPSWCQRSLKTVIDACAVGKTLHQVHAALQPPGTWLQTRQKRCHQKKKEEKYFQLCIYLYTHTYIVLLIIRPPKLQISPEMQKYGLYCHEKTHACFQCHANSVMVR